MAIAEKSTLFTWNSVQSGGTIEFEERALILTKSSVIAGAEDSTGAPIVKTATTAGTVLKAIEDVTNGGVVLSWENDEAGHTQNTDTGTTSQTFAIDSDTHNVKIKAESATKFGLRNAADDGYVNLQAATIKGQMLSLNPEAGESETYLVSELIPHNSIDEETLTVSNNSQRINVQAKRFLATQETPLDDLELTTKGWVDDQIAAGFAANDAMVMKGSIGESGVIDSKDINIDELRFGAALTTYSAGWVFLVTHAQTLAGQDAEANDKIWCIKDVTAGTYNAADWKVMQGNIVGAVTADVNLTDKALLIGDGGSNKKLKTFAFGSGNAGKFLRIKATDGELEWAVPPDTTYSGSTSVILNSTSFERAALTGDVTAAQNNNATTIANKAVSLAKMADMATASLIYRRTAGSGVPEVNTLSQLKTDLGTMPIAWSSKPAAYNSAGNAGDVAYDATDRMLYVCIAASTWRRTPLAKW